MLRRLGNRALRGEGGAVLPLVAVAMVVLLGFAALTIDIGNAMLEKRRLQSAVDLAALSASQKLPDVAAATQEAADFATANWNLNGKSPLSSPTVATGCRVAGCQSPDKVTISVSANVETHFAKLFGLDDIKVNARAAACGPCDSTVQKFDVMVVLDRSYSMCLSSSGANNGCIDLENAKKGIKSLLGFFDPGNDRVGLTLLSSGDDKSPRNDSSFGTYPCDTAATSGSGGTFAGSRGDFMDGTPSNHDSWVVAPLSSDFKNANGTLKASSAIVSAVDCVRSKYWTPIAPAIAEAAKELEVNGRSDSNVKKAIVFFGDGGANVQPMKRDSSGDATSEFSWYTPTAGNNLKPCNDAIGQANAAKAAGIEMYVIGYDLNTSSAQRCYKNNKPSDSSQDEGITATQTLQAMASDADHFHATATPEKITEIFNRIGRQITSGGSRLLE